MSSIPKSHPEVFVATKKEGISPQHVDSLRTLTSSRRIVDNTEGNIL